MKFLKKFNEMVDITDISTDSIYSTPHLDTTKNKNTIYDGKWESNLPSYITINYKNKLYKFKKGNIMLLPDIAQITYDSEPKIKGMPDTLEFDIYFNKNLNDNKIKIDIDITLGDLMVCEFSIEAPNKVSVIQHTTYHSKFDPSNTVFALTNESLNDFIKFLNKIPNMKISNNDLRFLDELDNYK